MTQEQVTALFTELSTAIKAEIDTKDLENDNFANDIKSKLDLLEQTVGTLPTVQSLQEVLNLANSANISASSASQTIMQVQLALNDLNTKDTEIKAQVDGLVATTGSLATEVAKNEEEFSNAVRAATAVFTANDVPVQQ